MEEELQRILSKWSAEDLNAVLRFYNGSCNSAASKILQHEKTGLRVGVLVRSLHLHNDSLPYANQRCPHQRGKKLASSTTNLSHPTKSRASRLQPLHDIDSMAALYPPQVTKPMLSLSLPDAKRPSVEPPELIYNAKRCNDRPKVLEGQSGRRCYCDTPPPAAAIQVEAAAHVRSDSSGYAPKAQPKQWLGKDLISKAPVLLVEAAAKQSLAKGPIPKECDQPYLCRPSLEDAASVPPLTSSQTEDLVWQLSPTEKDQLLCQLLTSKGRLCSQRRRDQLLRQLLSSKGQPDDRQRKQDDARVPIDDAKYSTTELDVLHFQQGLLLSFQEDREKDDAVEDIDDEALKLGMWMSRKESRESRHRQDRDEILAKMAAQMAISDRTKPTASHHHPTLLPWEKSIIEEERQNFMTCPDFFSCEDESSPPSSSTRKERGR